MNGVNDVRVVQAREVEEMVRNLLLKASFYLPEGMRKLLVDAEKREKIPLAKQAFGDILKNAALAAEKRMPICQDCGLAVIFVDVGQDVHVVGGGLSDAVNEGVRSAYRDGYLRKSVDVDPLFDRRNSGDNTPAVVHWNIVPGDKIKITVAPKGMGSENMSRLFMLKPADGADGVLNSVVEAVRLAGPNPCPPIVLGIGIGGNFETAPLAAKRALLCEAGVRNDAPEYAELERKIIESSNELGIGPGGYGGITTVLDAHIIALPTHIAGLPVAVNICCHALRHAEGTLGGVSDD